MNRAAATAIATAELKLLLRYLDEGITIRRENIERVLATLSVIRWPHIQPRCLSRRGRQHDQHPHHQVHLRHLR
jgi:hypothetical protein